MACLRAPGRRKRYGSVVQNIWTAGRITDPADPNKVDLGPGPRSVRSRRSATSPSSSTCLSEISEGITMGTDTSQANPHARSTRTR